MSARLDNSIDGELDARVLADILSAAGAQLHRDDDGLARVRPISFFCPKPDLADDLIEVDLCAFLTK